jgi:hypothetical protein
MRAITSLFGGGQQAAAPTQTPQVYFNTPSADDSKAKADAAAEEAKRKSMTESEQRKGAASSLLTAADLGSSFGKIPTRKTLLGGA